MELATTTTSQRPNYSEDVAEVFCRFLTQYKYPVAVIVGNPDTGKTDTGCLIAEVGKNEGVLDYLASNLNTGGAGQKITSLEDVKYWFRHQTGKKLYILDEAGINDENRSPLSKLNKEIRHEVFISRKFFAHWIFILQEMKDLDNWKDSNLTGLIIKKKCYNGEFEAVMKFKGEEDLLYFDEFPRTTVPFDTLDIALFTFERDILSEEGVSLQGIPAQVARLYAKTGNFSIIAKELKDETGKPMMTMQVKRALQQYIKQTLRCHEEPQKPDTLNNSA
jgi:hypothetical protein